MGTISRGLSLLNAFSPHDCEIGLSDFKAVSGFDKATVHRYLGELTRCGFLEKNRDTHKYRLGPAVLRLAAVREQTSPTRQIVVPVVDKLARELGELVHVALPEPEGMSTLYHKDHMVPGTRVSLNVAEMLPYHATSVGLVVLGFGPGDLLTETLGRPLTRYTPETITTPHALDREIARVRTQGFAQSTDGFESDVASVALPFFGVTDTAMGAIAVAAPVNRATDQRLQDFLRLLIPAAEALTRSFGGTIPDAVLENWRSAQSAARFRPDTQNPQPNRAKNPIRRAQGGLNS